MKKTYAVLRSYEDKMLPVLNHTIVLTVYEDSGRAFEAACLLNYKERLRRKEYEQKYKKEPDEKWHYYVNIVDLVESDEAIKNGD